MLSDRQRLERRRALQAIVASALAVALTISLTSGVPDDDRSTQIPRELGFVIE